MTFAAEMTSPERPGGARGDVAVPATSRYRGPPMQATARVLWLHNRMFIEFHAQGRLVLRDAPAAEIVAFLESDCEEPFSERRHGG